MARDFLSTVRSTVSRYGMIRPGETVVVAVSGGADSVALLHSLWRLREELGIDLVAAHLNHGIRGEEAERDAEFVQALAAQLGVPSVVEKAHVPQTAREMRLGVEEAARKARYEFLDRTALSSHAARIAVAHTADDQVETVLLNIIRGAGPDGLAGMPAVRGKVVRPLIELFRADVESYLRENRLSWRTDLTNFEAEHTRNRVRLELIPLLEQRFNPRVKEAVLTLSKLAADEAEVVRSAAEQAFRGVSIKAGLCSVELDAAALLGLSKAVARRCLRMAIEMVKGDLRDVEYAQVERVLDVLSLGRGFVITLPSGRVYAKLAGGVLQVFRKRRVERIEVVREIEAPGRTAVPELGVELEASLVPAETRPESRWEAVVDPAKIAGRLIVRTWRPGDSMIPLGMTGHKKLQDLFTDRKVPRDERVRVPVIADDEKIVWVAGLAVSEEAKVTGGARQGLLIQCWPIEPVAEASEA